MNPACDIVKVSGSTVLPAKPRRSLYLMLNKPAGVTSTVRDPHARQTILDLVTEVSDRLFPVGRLDVDSTGVLLLTNDGEFANRLTHPRYHIARVYRVRARGFVERDAAERLRDGVELSDGRTAPAQVQFVEYDSRSDTTVLDITLFEGKNRQVRRMMAAVGHPVRELCRIAFGPIRLRGLAPGTWRKLLPAEVKSLLEASATPSASQRHAARGSACRPTEQRAHK